jgi:hypothetical protein
MPIDFNRKGARTATACDRGAAQIRIRNERQDAKNAKEKKGES